MTELGSFIYGGNERILVAQFAKSPGVFFSSEDKLQVRSVEGGEIRNVLVNTSKAELRPERGYHITFTREMAPESGPVKVQFSNGRVASLITFLDALGFTKKEIQNLFPKYLYKKMQEDVTKGQEIKASVAHIAQCMGLANILDGSIGEDDFEKIRKTIQKRFYGGDLGRLGRGQVNRRIERVLPAYHEDSLKLTKGDIAGVLTAFVDLSKVGFQLTTPGVSAISRCVSWEIILMPHSSTGQAGCGSG